MQPPHQHMHEAGAIDVEEAASAYESAVATYTVQTTLDALDAIKKAIAHLESHELSVDWVAFKQRALDVDGAAKELMQLTIYIYRCCCFARACANTSASGSRPSCTAHSTRPRSRRSSRDSAHVNDTCTRQALS